jgi:hypothetical protein
VSSGNCFGQICSKKYINESKSKTTEILEVFVAFTPTIGHDPDPVPDNLIWIRQNWSGSERIRIRNTESLKKNYFYDCLYRFYIV